MFVEKNTEDSCEVIVLRYAAAFYWWMWPTLALTVWASIQASTAVYIAAAIAWALLLAVAIPYWPVIARLKKEMRNASVTASGSKYSFSHPLTYRLEQPSQRESSN